MPLDPDAETLLGMMRAAGRPPMETLSPDEAREAFKAGRAVTQPDPQDVADVRDLSCPGPHGPIPLRAYRPIGTSAHEVLPALVYYHGGGWLLGDLDSHDVACRHYANAARCRVVSVDYRMAPEYKFPAAVDDCGQPALMRESGSRRIRARRRPLFHSRRPVLVEPHRRRHDKSAPRGADRVGFRR